MPTVIRTHVPAALPPGTHIPSLDGIRAVAIGLVMLFHARFPYLPGAFAGVDVFFVLGGYLITWLLQGECLRNGRVDVRAFYVRRIGRLVPALLAMLIVYLCLAPMLWPGKNHPLQAMLALLGLADYARAFAGVPLYLTHTWSLAVEHHFYLLWPLLLPWILRYREPLIPLGGLYLAAWTWRLGCLYMGQEWGEMYYRFDTRISGLVLGSGLAVLLERPTGRAWIWRYKQYALVALPMLAMLMLTQSWRDSAFWRSGLPLLELAVALLVAGASMGIGGLGWLSWGWMRFLGKISYGLYLWHYPIFFYLRDLYGWGHVLAWGGLLSLFMACVSWYTVETWGRRWRAGWLKRRPSAGGGPAPATGE